MEAVHHRHDISTRFASFRNRIFQGVKGLVELLRVIIGSLSTLYSGYSALTLHGGIYTMTMETGKIPTAVLPLER